MVYKFTKFIMENPIEMDDLVAPPFMETPKLQTWIIPCIIGITGASPSNSICFFGPCIG
jgi:hypothetical protein